MFISEICRKVKGARERLYDRLREIRSLLSKEGLDDKFRSELEAEKSKIIGHLKTRVTKIQKEGE